MSAVRKTFLPMAWLAVANLVLAAPQSGEYQAKARFLANAPGFVEWPSDVFRTPEAPVQICVHGDFSFGTALAESTRGESVKGRHLEVKWVRPDQSLSGCQVVFFSRSLAKRYSKELQTVKDSASLTVGEDPDFLKAGGMLTLEPTAQGLRFDVNLDAVQQQRLRISSQLLSLARHVFQGGTELARG